MVDVEVIAEFNTIAVKFNGITHLRILRSKLMGFQTWRVSDKEYHIEFTLDGGSIHTEYDDKEKWTAIIAGFDREL